MASTTKFVEQDIQPLSKRLWDVMQDVQAVENAYFSLGGESFIKQLAGSEPIVGFTDITGDQVVNFIATIITLRSVWVEGHDDNTALIAKGT